MPPQSQDNFSSADLQPKKKFPKWVKFTSLILAILISVAVLFVIFEFWQTKKFSDGCRRRVMEIIETNNFFLADDNKCPEGYHTNALRCIYSLVWCEPDEISKPDSVKNEEENMYIEKINYPKEFKGLLMELNVSENTINLLSEPNIVNGYPNYLPGKYDYKVKIMNNNEVLGEYGFRDPTIILAERGYTGPTKLESADITLIIPYFEGSDKVNIFHLGKLIFSQDIVN